MARMWSGELPRSLQFIIDFNNTSIGRIAVGPLYDRGKIDAEAGYALLEVYSGQGIMSRAASCLMDLLRYLVDTGVYDLKRIRATAKPGNTASNKILIKNNFTKSADMVDDGYSPENEYFYYFGK